MRFFKDRKELDFSIFNKRNFSSDVSCLRLIKNQAFEIQLKNLGIHFEGNIPKVKISFSIHFLISVIVRSRICIRSSLNSVFILHQMHTV